MIKLYDEDSYIFDFEAEVTECCEVGGEYKILLNRTAFFPTAGGQDCDTGVIDGERVIRVEIEDELVYHYTKVPFEVGKAVACKIDREPRLRKMQHHTAEHIVSGIVHRELGLENVGFHLSDEEVTMDYDGAIPADKLMEIEALANRAVRDNIEITCQYPDEALLPQMEYRSKLDLTENVRIVTIPGVDVCACCAPHVKRTGEIGVIKLKDMMSHRGGVRITMICAGDAVSDYQKKHKIVAKISNLLSAKQYEIADSVERVMGELEKAKQRCSELEKLLVSEKAKNIAETDGNICLFESDISVDAMRALVNIGKGKCGGVCVGCLGCDKDGYTYIIGSNGCELSGFARTINEALQGRGGGRGDMISGKFTATQKEIESYFETFTLE